MECSLIPQTHSLCLSALSHSKKCSTYKEHKPMQPGKTAHWDSNSGWVSDHCRRQHDVDKWNSSLTVCTSYCTSYGLCCPAAMGCICCIHRKAVMMCVVLLVNGRQAGAVWRGRDRQLCVSNASSWIWVTLTPLSYCQIISPSSMIWRVILS